MSNTSWAGINGVEDVVLQDGDRPKIQEAFEKLREAGVPNERIDTLMRYLDVTHCPDCGRYWLEQNTHDTPGWVPDIYGRGRRVDTSVVYNALQDAGWVNGSACESCVFKRVPNIAAAITKLPNKLMKSFFKLYARRVQQLTHNSKYRDSFSYRFHVALATELIKILPAKQRKSFAKLSEVLATLEIL